MTKFEVPTEPTAPPARPTGYPAQPILLNVYFAGTFSWILFIENKVSFERVIRDAREALLGGRFTPYAGAALIYSRGDGRADAKIVRIQGVLLSGRSLCCN
ncbi:hypothetical protein [Bradyrhizobium lablabi]|uniref:hypothetical protein n=1 Tax=Bradyrhizobium lablabi TaxID=722472 RepID=UPI0018F8B81B|nr:hypothetical protein [Bradyrhizobium lablabi]